MYTLYGNANVHRDMPLLVRMAERGQLDLGAMVSRRISLDEVNDGLDAIESGEVIRSVIVN
jgi:S-(hydroxymethyl)glutathione dehydrogenase/alcohol dehydrogenase